MFYQITIENSSTSLGSIDTIIYDQASISKALVTFTQLVLLPVISFIGISGNVISIVILSRDGLHKCSNVLICVLAVADSMYLIGINNVPNILMNQDFTTACRLNDLVAVLFAIVNNLFSMLENTGMIVSMLVPTLIVVERFVAVFFPFHFTKIVTPLRNRVAAACLFPLAIPLLTMNVFIYHDAIICNGTDVIFTLMGAKLEVIHIYTLLTKIYSTVCGPVSVCFVSFGCVLISIKVQAQQSVRRAIITRRKSTHGREGKLHKDSERDPEFFKSTRTTKILISVCCVYSLTGTLSFMSDLVVTPQNVGFEMSFWIHRASLVCISLNSTANFIIYVAFNRKFRDAYVTMFFYSIRRKK
ncbi:somatostatin-like receptor [Biomphalaria glabrata]|nr:somatostatin-like receptor [Biomphalaria glabrata]